MSTQSVHHPHIWITVSMTRGKLEMRRDSMAYLAYTTLCWIPPYRIPLILRPRLFTDRCIWSRCTKIISSMRYQVSGNIHAWWMHSLCGGLGTVPLSLANRRF